MTAGILTLLTLYLIYRALHRRPPPPSPPPRIIIEIQINDGRGRPPPEPERKPLPRSLTKLLEPTPWK